MANCSKCYRYIKNSNKQYYADGENQKVLLCDKCYHEGRAEQIKSNTTVGSQNVEVSGITNHNKVMTPEEIKKEFEKGPPKVDDKEPHIIDHDDENEGYLWIDGKKIKKDNPDESK